MAVPNLAIFASGSGSNAEKIVEQIAKTDDLNVGLIICNRERAGIYERATRLDVPIEHMPRRAFEDAGVVLALLHSHGITHVALAGWLVQIPPYLIEAYAGCIYNIHPALLPKYGGLGMYGHYVHEAVAAAGDAESGITIHHVTEDYDEGQIILQARVALSTDDDAEEIGRKVLELEHYYYPRVVVEMMRYSEAREL